MKIVKQINVQILFYMWLICVSSFSLNALSDNIDQAIKDSNIAQVKHLLRQNLTDHELKWIYDLAHNIRSIREKRFKEFSLFSDEMFARTVIFTVVAFFLTTTIIGIPIVYIVYRMLDKSYNSRKNLNEELYLSALNIEYLLSERVDKQESDQ